METVAAPIGDNYPVRLEVGHKDRLSRLSTFFRLILAIPLLIAVGLLGGGTLSWGAPAGVGFGLASGILLFHWVSVLVRGRPVRWIYDVLVAIHRFIYRSYTYFLLLNDRYPPFEGGWETTYGVQMPERLSRWKLAIWKTIATIPHFIALSVVSFAVAVVVFISWFAILFSGRFPKGLHDFVAGWLRWSARVSAYWMSLTDDFPAFGFSAEIGRGQNSSYVISCVVGVLITAAAIGGIATLIAYPADTEEVTVAYDDLLAGVPSDIVAVDDFLLFVGEADDDYALPGGLLEPEVGNRFVLFTVATANEASVRRWIEENDFRLKDSGGDKHRPVLVTVDGIETPEYLDSGETGLVAVLFEIDGGSRPEELTYSPSFGFKKRVKFIIE
jgi:hypothetical protein